MTRILKVVLPVLVAAFAMPAFAETVDFNTTGAFDCDGTVANNPAKPGEPSTCTVSPDKSLITITNNGNTVTIKAIGDSYTGILADPGPLADKNVVTLNDTSTSNVSVCLVALVGGKCPAGKSVVAGAVGITGAEFTLDFNQTKCVGCDGAGTGSGVMADALSGKVFFKNTKAQVIFGNGVNLPTVTIDHVTYTLDQATYPLANPGKLTDIPGFGSETFTAQVTPEPTFMLLSGLGFAGLAFVAYKRKRTV
jgi:hypothetical protein